MEEIILETKNLKKYFNTPLGNLHAVDGINLAIKKGQTLGVVGESGCGKSTLARTILRLIPPTGGQIYFQGKDIMKYNKKELKFLRKEIQMIFQDPYSSLNPRLTVSEIIAEPLIVNGLSSNRFELHERVTDLMDLVGLSPKQVNTYPHELDGGRRQRIGVARALALKPKLIVCDEPVSALDVSIQAQILNLMMDLQEELGLTYMFISHDLSVVKHISDHIAVMYLGQCVELAPSRDLFENPLHPYTKALLNAIPIADISYRNRKRQILKGEVTSPINPSPGCRFAPRCPLGDEGCTSPDLVFKEIKEDHFVLCRKII